MTFQSRYYCHSSLIYRLKNRGTEREGDEVGIQTGQFLEFVLLDTVLCASNGIATLCPEFNDFITRRTGVI